MCSAYRRAIDDAVAGRPFNPELITQLEGLANRGFTAGFLERRPSQDYQSYELRNSVLGHSHYVGEVVAGGGDGWSVVEVKNKFQVGDQIEVIHPSGNHTVTLEHMRNLDGEPITVAPGSPLQVRIPA